MAMLLTHLLFLGRIGLGQVLLIVLIVVILFGGKKIPELMRGMGRGIREFKDAMDKPASDDDKAGKEGPDAKETRSEEPEEKK